MNRHESAAADNRGEEFQPSHDDHFGHRLALAVACIGAIEAPVCDGCRDLIRNAARRTFELVSRQARNQASYQVFFELTCHFHRYPAGMAICARSVDSFSDRIIAMLGDPEEKVEVRTALRILICAGPEAVTPSILQSIAELWASQLIKRRRDSSDSYENVHDVWDTLMKARRELGLDTTSQQYRELAEETDYLMEDEAACKYHNGFNNEYGPLYIDERDREMREEREEIWRIREIPDEWERICEIVHMIACTLSNEDGNSYWSRDLSGLCNGTTSATLDRLQAMSEDLGLAFEESELLAGLLHGSEPFLATSIAIVISLLDPSRPSQRTVENLLRSSKFACFYTDIQWHGLNPCVARLLQNFRFRLVRQSHLTGNVLWVATPDQLASGKSAPSPAGKVRLDDA